MDNVTAADPSGILARLNTQTKTPEKADSGADFLQLLVAQLENQDPLNPQDGTEFLSQLAQLESVQGIQELNQSFSTFATSQRSNQALQATSLVGRDVLVNSGTGLLESGKALTGRLELPSAASSVRLSVFNSSGELVRDLSLGDQPKGGLAFSWDGLGNNKQALPAGQYRLEGKGSINGKNTDIATAVNFNVNSVTLDPKSGTLLNLAGRSDPVSLNKVLQVR